MEKDFRSFMPHQQHFDEQLLNVNSSAVPFDAGLQQRINTFHTAPGVNNTVSTKQNYPITALPVPVTINEPHGWFYHMPCFRQGFVPGVNLPSVKLPKKVPATTSPRCSPKQFLVFDQSGDKTTLIYSLGTGSPICKNSDSLPFVKCNNADTENNGIWTETQDNSGPGLTDEPNANCSEAEDESEMREDTEEINALLYSDDDRAQEEEDDDEVSTGHSPSIMTAHQDDSKNYLEVEDGEEVSSSDQPTKRQRISEEGYNDFPSFVNTASSDRTFSREDDAESKCGNNDTDSICGMKRLRKEKIREAVEILQSIIPGGQKNKAKDPSIVLEESIRYLKSLKHKARSLGLSAL